MFCSKCWLLFAIRIHAHYGKSGLNGLFVSPFSSYLQLDLNSSLQTRQNPVEENGDTKMVLDLYGKVKPSFVKKNIKKRKETVWLLDGWIHARVGQRIKCTINFIKKGNY